MSKHLEKMIFKSLSAAAVKGFVDFNLCLNFIRRQTPIQSYHALVKTYFDVWKKKFKSVMYTGQRNVIDLGFNCSLDSLGFESDFVFVGEWLSLHSNKINKYNEVLVVIQDNILSGNFAHAESVLDNFQKENGWSFWGLELKYYLVHRSGGMERVKELSQWIKNKAGTRIITFASAMFSERIDEKHSIDAIYSRWSDILEKNLKGRKRVQRYYSFRGLGRVDDYQESLAECLTVDFSNSVYDCYSTFLETAMSIIAAQEPKGTYGTIAAMMRKVKSAGVKDYRIDKILYFVDENYCGPTGSVSSQLADVFTEKLTSHNTGFYSELAELNVISLLNQGGVSEHHSLAKLEKLSLSLRPLPVGPALGGFVTSIASSYIEKIAMQPWASFVSSSFKVEECFSMRSDDAWSAIQKIAVSTSNPDAVHAAVLIDVKAGSLDEQKLDIISNTSALWLSAYLLRSSRFKECDLIVEHLCSDNKYWQRQAEKLQLEIYCGKFELSKAIELALGLIKKDPVFFFEYPLFRMFEENSWGEFSGFDPIVVSLVAHYANASLLSKDEEIQYICKMGCRKVHLIGGKEILSNELVGEDTPRRKVLIDFFANVWVQENLTLLNFKTSREVMAERLEVLRMLVQLDSDKEQIYASEIMDITLRDTLWAGLTHVEETRIFVNEAGIARWAEKELRHDFDNWKELESSDAGSTAILQTQLLEYSQSPTADRLDELKSDELTEDNKLLLSIVERLEAKFLNDPLDGLHCYLSARIRHGTVKNTFLGPIDEGGLLVAEGKLDESCYKYFEGIDDEALECVVKPALFTLSEGLLKLINDAILNKIRIRDDKHPQGYIQINHDVTFFGKVIAVLGAKLEFQHFVSVSFGLFWELLKPSLMKLYDYFSTEFQEKTHQLFENAVQEIEPTGNASRSLVVALRRIGSMTALQCTVAAKWFHSESHVSEREFKLCEAIDIACKTSKNIYRRFNARIIFEDSDCTGLPLSGIGLGAIVESVSITLENAWKYSGLGEEEYEIHISSSHDVENNFLTFTVVSPLSNLRAEELTPVRLDEIRRKFQKDLEVESVASEGGSGLPKIARYSIKIDRTICPEPLTINIVDSEFVVKACIPLHKRGGMYDVYSN
ncbi:hypothetical protein [Pseudomonas protegens]|uniref:hypothetical protein n=1 Tax=Pseudomonas protegens TaxID=380021 RepID=UPI0011CDC8FF|nr:hypothetical protein [Pseudomonas protegens]